MRCALLLVLAGCSTAPSWVSETVEGGELEVVCGTPAHQPVARLPSADAVFVAEACGADGCSPVAYWRVDRDIVAACPEWAETVRVRWIQLGPDRSDGSTPWSPVE